MSPSLTAPTADDLRLMRARFATLRMEPEVTAATLAAYVSTYDSLTRALHRPVAAEWRLDGCTADECELATTPLAVVMGRAARAGSETVRPGAGGAL